MADWPPLKNSAFSVQYPIYDADGDTVIGATGLDSEVSIDGGAFTDVSPGEATEITGGNGVYVLALAAGEMNGDIIATITKSNGKPAVNVMYTVTRQLIDLAYPATSGRSLAVETDGMVEATVEEWIGVVPNALVAGAVDADVSAIQANAITAAAIANAAIDAATFAAGAIDAAAIANGAIDAATFAAGAIDATAIAAAAITATEAPNLDAAISSRSSHSDTDVWDVDATGRQTQGTFGQAIGDPIADADTIFGMLTDLEDGNTVVEANVASIDANAITAAAIANGAIDAATFAAGAIDATAIANAAIDAATFAANAIDATAIATGAIDADALAADTITAAKIATDSIGADEISAAGANEIADAILVRDMDQVEATAPVHSLTTAILKAVSRIRDNAGTLEVYRTNGSTLHMSQTVTIDASLDPIDELTIGT